MKRCPSCGYEDTKTQRQMLALYRKHFGDLPVQEMLHRGWIRGPIDPIPASGADALLASIRAEMIRFFQLKSEAELDGFIAGTFDPLRRIVNESEQKEGEAKDG